ncbi:hypothetical protein NPIL_200792 [Nephila pilipes]|uniref:Uncharacterized protein n=1 Tax=Nephila pilipes TaxID=299642 RepID=A0A8X6NH06_NEPPI|nr:hypothetical protein NPIL_200792 [Nephila pilipes]
MPSRLHIWCPTHLSFVRNTKNWWQQQKCNVLKSFYANLYVKQIISKRVLQCMDITGNQMGSISNLQNTHDFASGDNVMSKDEILPKHEKLGFIRRWFLATCLCLSKNKKEDSHEIYVAYNPSFKPAS